MIDKYQVLGGLRFARFVRKLSQDELGRLAGVDQTIISRAERGVRISPRARAAIAAALDIKVDVLFGSSESSDGSGMEKSS